MKPKPMTKITVEKGSVRIEATNSTVSGIRVGSDWVLPPKPKHPWWKRLWLALTSRRRGG